MNGRRQQSEANRLSGCWATLVKAFNTNIDDVQKQSDDEISNCGSQASNQTSEVDAGLIDKQPAKTQPVEAAAVLSMKALIALMQAMRLVSFTPKAEIRLPLMEQKTGHYSCYSSKMWSRLVG